jgi:2-polyprenyl-3-methyl-5-hydroxy-6-metoxy-1,4-benzoquinol methylase
VSKAEIERFLSESEIDNYQRIELPHGLVTPGRDRRATADLVFRSGVQGRSVLDVGCKYGYFCHEALRRGAVRAKGVDVNADSIRIGRRIAEFCKREIEFECIDFGDLAGGERFDVVLFLNMLHHGVDPVATLRKLAALTSELLVVELATPRDHQTHVPRWARGIFGLLARRLPIAYVGDTPDRRFWYLSERAFENLLVTQLALFERVEFATSPQRRGRTIAYCWK